MEGGSSSNFENKYTRRARTSGVVIREGGADPTTAPTAAVANIPFGDVNQAQQAAPFEREANGYMRIASITRIMRRVLPEHAKITNDAKEAIQAYVSQFISFITAEANGRCNHDYRSTVTAEDVLAAMASLGFNEYLEPLSVFLSKHRAQDPERRSANHQLYSGGCDFVHQPQATQMVRPPPPGAATTTKDEDEFGGFTQGINEYTLRNYGGGIGSSNDNKFDPFSRNYK